MYPLNQLDVHPTPAFRHILYSTLLILYISSIATLAMTSPYPLFPASSPYQPSDLPSPLGALLPSIAQSTSGLGLTPGSNPFLALQAGGGGAGGVVGAGGSTLIGSSGLGGGGSVRSVNTGSIRKEETVSLEDCLRGLGEVGRMIERAEEVLGEIKTLRGNVFGYGSIEIGGEADGGRLECEYLHL
jgi:hypothetical protein